MPGARTSDIQLPLPPGETPDPTIPGRAQRQADVALQKSSRTYEHRPATPDPARVNPLKHLAGKVDKVGKGLRRSAPMQRSLRGGR